MAGKKKKKGGFSIISLLILLIAIGVFCFAGYKLYGILHVYHETNKEYEDIRETYTKPSEPQPEITIESEAASDNEYEDGTPPITVDWTELKNKNKDIVGWIYIEALPDISYPICQGEDNDYYLHRTFEKKNLFAGSIFIDYENSPKFDDPNTIVYGHNMKNGSMFGKLRRLKEEETFAKSPYMWILTPDGDYRYRIFSVFDTPYNSDVYTQFSGAGQIVLDWANKMHEQAVIPTGINLKEDDFYVTLSTCTANSSVRCVAIAKCVSSTRPVKHERRKITSIPKQDQ